MDEEQKRHLSVAGASGFPFQLAVEASIASHRETYWRVALREHPWNHYETGRNGYIDLLLENSRLPTRRMVVECKRQRGDARWYFLDPESSTPAVRHIYTSDHLTGPAARDTDLYPRSPQSAFCVIPGEGGGGRPTLESMADDLLQATEALAAEQLALDSSAASHFYLPVVVTNAQLFTCECEPADISLETGDLPASAAFQRAPFVRFRKTLWSHSSGSAEPETLLDAHRERERTIIVVCAAQLQGFLRHPHFTTW